MSMVAGKFDRNKVVMNDYRYGRPVNWMVSTESTGWYPLNRHSVWFKKLELQVPIRIYGIL